MRPIHQIETASTEQFASCLGLAIYEARLVRSFVQSGAFTYKPEILDPDYHRLKLLDREIELLETKLRQVRWVVDRS